MAKRPNVLWIMTDEQRPDSLGCYGSSWAHTPNLDRLAAQGSVFTQCHVQSPMCVPSRTSLLHSRYPQETNVYSNAVQGAEGVLDPNAKAFPNVFADAGYRTCSLGKWHTPKHPTWQEYDTFYGYLDVCNPCALGEGYDEAEHNIIKNPGSFMDGIHAPVILGGIYPHHDWGTDVTSHLTDMSIEWLRRAAERDEPFLLRVSYVAPHTPVLVPRPWYGFYGPEDVPCNALQFEAAAERSSYDQWQADIMRGLDMSMDEWRQCAADYYSLCVQVDYEVGRLMHMLEELGLADNTIVAYNSDHGRSLGEFGHCQKGTFDSEVVRVPFILSWPGHVPVARRDDLCELIDFGPTILRLAGLDPAAGTRGRDLFDSPEPEAVFSVLDMHLYRRAAIRTRDWRLDCTYAYEDVVRPREHIDANLIHIAEDPLELRNLIHHDGYDTELDELYTQLDTWMRIGA